ncbi:MAG: hypothetical protein EOO88_01215 [Pedobacter sp.]|nr:MAG: hypothetical protein EOO88_01215 [Pedobacter sp.]
MYLTSFYRKFLWLFIPAVVGFTSLAAQSPGTALFELSNGETNLKFEIVLPPVWVRQPALEGGNTVAVFRDSTYSPAKKRGNCLDTALVHLMIFRGDLSETMQQLGFRKMNEGMYTTQINGRISVAISSDEKRNNYNGLDCGFYTDELCSGQKIKKTRAEMRYLLFSNGSETICFVNNGQPIPEAVAEQLFSSFTFK